MTGSWPPQEHRDGGRAGILLPVRSGSNPLTQNTAPCTSRQHLDHARAPRDYCALVFDWGGGGAGMLPAMCRPTRRFDGHPAAIAL
eukprot:3111679-Pyramimonas_sp.AAC.1